MVTPKVVEEVRAHFGCPTLEGAELEDQVKILFIAIFAGNPYIIFILEVKFQCKNYMQNIVLLWALSSGLKHVVQRKCEKMLVPL
jgi:hypothetical protein